MKLPPYTNGIRVVRYHNGRGPMWRVDYSNGRGFDCAELPDDVARIVV